jgi:subtilisin-like proprotein convertase family protein
VRIFSVGKRGRRRGDSTITEADDTAKSGAAAGEAEGGSWHLDVEDDQRKLGR